MRFYEILLEADNPATFWQKPSSIEWWQARAPRFKNEQAVREWMFQQLEYADKQSHISLFGGPNGSEINRQIADGVPIYRTRQGIIIGNRPKISRARQPMIGTEQPEGSAPDVAWHNQDLQDTARYVTSETIKRDYVPEKYRKRVTVYPAYVPNGVVPDEICAEEQCDDDDGGGSYDWKQFHFRGSPPPAKLEVKTSGKIVIVDGNHRIRWWRQSGYDDIPAWVIDYRRVKPRLSEALMVSSEKEGPAFEHDCSQCVFVGADHPQQGEPRVNQIDMYVHRTPSHTTLIRRYGSEPSNYSSQELSDRISAKYQRVLDAARQMK